MCGKWAHGFFSSLLKIVMFPSLTVKGEYKLFRKSITLEFGNPIDVNKMEIEEGNEYLRNEVLKLYRK